jgi:hypothetical protein
MPLTRRIIKWILAWGWTQQYNRRAMITDPLFYRLFETSPETFFLLLGMPADAARETAARYQYQAIEFKETAHRVDGVFLPKEPGLPLYFLEVQFYPLSSVFADLLAKVFTYLKQHDPAQDFVAVVLFAGRTLEPPDAASYRPLMEAGLIRRFTWMKCSNCRTHHWVCRFSI